MTSAFEQRSLNQQLKEVQDAYLSDRRPWIVGFSGGKDSTAALHLIWLALAGLSPDQRFKEVIVIASDTGVESPAVAARLAQSIEQIGTAARAAKLPLRAEVVTPALKDSYWVNLIGRGYAAPSVKFRWCTERLKINPTNRFILEQVSRAGEVVVLLGSRRAESIARAQVLALHRKTGERYSRHSTLKGALIYPVIEDWTDDDVWSFLLQNPCPWGGQHRDLAALYRNAAGGECPLVLDTTTSSCGSSRFGCWVCTVVTRDRSMEGLIDAGETWMEPLLAFRDELAITQDPARKLEFRETRRRNGRVKLSPKGQIVPGPYRFEVCQHWLRQVLEIQQQLRRDRPSQPELISLAELMEIRRIWRTERQDWDDRVPSIHHEVTGEVIDWPADDVTQLHTEDRELLSNIGQRHGAPVDLLTALLDLERHAFDLELTDAHDAQLERLLTVDWWAKPGDA